MPLFMDRHYSENPTREAVELAHLKDLEMQDKFGVKFLTYWFDEKRGTTFCLVEAENETVIRKFTQRPTATCPTKSFRSIRIP